MSTPDAPPPDDGALSVDQAVELIVGPEAAEEEAAAEAAAGEAEQPDRPAAAEPPAFWSEEDQAAFGELPAHLQQTVAEHEEAVATVALQAIEGAQAAWEAAEARAAHAGDLTDRLSAIVPQVEAAFAARWGEPDWNRVAAERGPQAAAALKAQFDQEQAHLLQLAQVQQAAEAEQFDGYVVNEYEKLKAIEPDLADGERGLQRRQAVVEFLAQSGIREDQIRHLGALEMALAYDALRYRLASHAMAHPQRPAAVRPSLSPAAAQAQRSSQTRRSEALKSRFAKKPTIDNAVAALLGKG